MRLKKSRYSGKIHPSNYQCKLKPKPIRYNKERSHADNLRGRAVWKRKRAEIKKRDNFLCQICLRKLYRTVTILNYKEALQVHHIVPIEEDESLWLEDDNLITLCGYHHRLAEQGSIPKEELIEIVIEQINKRKKYSPLYIKF